MKAYSIIRMSNIILNRSIKHRWIISPTEIKKKIRCIWQVSYKIEKEHNQITHWTAGEMQLRLVFFLKYHFHIFYFLLKNNVLYYSCYEMSAGHRINFFNDSNLKRSNRLFSLWIFLSFNVRCWTQLPCSSQGFLNRSF